MMSGGYSAVIYFRNGTHEYYKIDLDCLPERLEPFPYFDDNYAGWTVVDECIYCIGGINRITKGNRRTVRMNWTKYNTENLNSTWDPISPSRNLRLFEPSVFAWGRNIYVVTGSPYKSDDCYESEDRAYWGEYYNLDSQTWSYLPKQTPIEFESLSAFHTAMDQNTIVFHSVYSDILLFYDVNKEEWTKQYHPDLIFCEGLEKCNCLNALLYVANSRPAVVCHSTLYWLNIDMCLYGYDYGQRRWFQSNSLPKLALAWPFSVDHDSIFIAPLLFYLNDQTFVAICPADKLELGMAIIGVKRLPDRIDVSLKLYKTFPVTTVQGAGSHSTMEWLFGRIKGLWLEKENLHRRTNGWCCAV